MRKCKIFYGWIVVIGCMMLAAASTGFLSYFNALFVQQVTEDIRVSRTRYMAYATFSSLTTMIFMPFAARLFRKIPMKRLLYIGGALGALSQIIYSVASNVIMFYVGGIIAGVATCLYGAIPIAILTSNWFYEKKGIATGLAFAGTGIVSAVFTPVVQYMIDNFGYRAAYRFIAICIMAFVGIATGLLIKIDPTETGELPLGKEATTEKQQYQREYVRTGFAKEQILHTKTFWLFATAIFLIGSFTMATQQQLVAYWQEEGNSSEWSAMMYSVTMTVAIFAKIGLGFVYDKLSVKTASVLICGTGVLDYILLIAFTQGKMVIVPAALFGTVIAMQVIVTTYVTNRLFGEKEYGYIYGIMNPVLYCGVALGIPASAAIYECVGTYKIPWLLFAGFVAIVLILILFADKASRREYREILHVEREE